MLALCDHITKSEPRLHPDRVSVLCQSRFEVQHWYVLLDFFLSFLANLVGHSLNCVVVLESGDLAIALLFNSLDDHADSWNFGLSCDQGDFVVGLKYFFGLCYCSVDVNVCFALDVLQFDLCHWNFLKMD